MRIQKKFHVTDAFNAANAQARPPASETDVR